MREWRHQFTYVKVTLQDCHYHTQTYTKQQSVTMMQHVPATMVLVLFLVFQAAPPTITNITASKHYS